MKRYVQAKTTATLLILFIATALASLGCTIRLVSDYDEVLDKDVTTLQESTETFLSQLDFEAGSPAAAYSANRDFYVKTDASLRTMATRAASQPRSTIVLAQVKELQKSFDDLQKLHELDGDKGLSAGQIGEVRGALESEFGSILTLQLALKSHNGIPAAAIAPSK
jgi:hypothetical protein